MKSVNEIISDCAGLSGEEKKVLAQALVSGTPSKLREKISDGYHTFNELYEHRIRLFISLCLGLDLQVYEVWRSKVHSDGSIWEGWFILGIGKEPGKQITYHLPDKYWDELDGRVFTWDRAPEWDGHTSADVLERLKALDL